MERQSPRSVGEVLREVLQQNNLQQIIDETRAKNLWREVVGAEIAHECKTPYVANGVMTVGIPNAALRHEMSMNRSLLRETINSIIGKNTIKEIRFTS